MPRTAPSQTIEHRISLSNFERQQLDSLAKSYTFEKRVENVGRIMQGVGIVGAGLGVYLGAKYVAGTWATIEEKYDAVESNVQRAWRQVITDPAKYWLYVFGLRDEDPYKQQ